MYTIHGIRSTKIEIRSDLMRIEMRVFGVSIFWGPHEIQKIRIGFRIYRTFGLSACIHLNHKCDSKYRTSHERRHHKVFKKGNANKMYTLGTLFFWKRVCVFVNVAMILWIVWFDCSFEITAELDNCRTSAKNPNLQIINITVKNVIISLNVADHNMFNGYQEIPQNFWQIEIFPFGS